VQIKDLPFVKALVGLGSNVNLVNSKTRLLFTLLPLTNGVAIFKYLESVGADKAARNRNGKTPADYLSAPTADPATPVIQLYFFFLI